MASEEDYAHEDYSNDQLDQAGDANDVYDETGSIIFANYQEKLDIPESCLDERLLQRHTLYSTLTEGIEESQWRRIASDLMGQLLQKIQKK